MPGRLVVWSSGRLVAWSPSRLVVWSSGRLVVCRPCCGPAMDHRTDAPRNENRKLEPKAVPGEFQAQGVLRAAAENVRPKVCRELVPKSGSLLVPDFGGQRKVTYGFVPFRCAPKSGSLLVPEIGTKKMRKKPNKTFTIAVRRRLRPAQPRAKDRLAKTCLIAGRPSRRRNCCARFTAA